MECAICKKPLREEDASDYQGKKLCEDCYIEALSPSPHWGTASPPREGLACQVRAVAEGRDDPAHRACNPSHGLAT
ncbi:hypothetical protein [Holophaga foetida]|uniref:hypothetical protein n=1 Tax=Holophaga foetida TaxID=35839 RepID=UPI0002475028|nr:hypothetical protein [Holophaga foetida]